jgi:hypothetical protein
MTTLSDAVINIHFNNYYDDDDGLIKHRSSTHSTYTNEGKINFQKKSNDKK